MLILSGISADIGKEGILKSQVFRNPDALVCFQHFHVVESMYYGQSLLIRSFNS